MGNLRLLILLAALGCKKPAPIGPITLTAEVVAPVDDALLAAWTEELVPLVERFGGRRFQAPPTVRFFDRDGFSALVARESKLIMDAVHKDTPEVVRQRKADEQAAVGIAGLFGKYGLYDRTTYVVREAIERASSDPLEARNLARVVLAHELAHALQNDGLDPETLFAEVHDEEHFLAWASVSEGGANFIALRVARELGIEPAFWSMSKLQGWGPAGLEVPGAYDIWMRYGRGMSALEEVVEAEGMEGFWRWHTHPPIQSSMIFRPSTYGTTLPARDRDLAGLLRGTEQSLTRGDWMTSNSRLGEYHLRGEAIRTGQEADFEPVLAHLLDAQHLDLAMPDRTADIRILQFDGPGPALDYLSLLRREQTIEGQQIAKQLGVTVEVDYAPVEGVQGDASLLRTQRVPLGGGRYREERTAWVVRGAVVIAVKAVDFRPGLRLAETLNEVFERLDATPGSIVSPPR